MTTSKTYDLWISLRQSFETLGAMTLFLGRLLAYTPARCCASDWSASRSSTPARCRW